MTRFILICALLVSVEVSTAAIRVRLASEHEYETQVLLYQLDRMERLTHQLKDELDRRCDDSHERLMAITRWYIMRRSGPEELDRFEKREAAWENTVSQQ